MSITADKPPHEGYDSFYQSGGWRYDLAEEALFLHFRVLQPLGVGAGRAIELGCGVGVHSEALRLLMGSACGIDTSTVAIARAVEHFPDTEFSCGDALEVLGGCGVCDLIFVRGMSWFHYALERGASPYPLDSLMQASFASLRSGGHFVLQIRSDFSGDYDAATGIRHHRVSQLRAWARRYGRVRMLTDWMGLPLLSDADGRASGRNALVAVQKV